jgi:hypothetical protein
VLFVVIKALKEGKKERKKGSKKKREKGNKMI